MKMQRAIGLSLALLVISPTAMASRFSKATAGAEHQSKAAKVEPTAGMPPPSGIGRGARRSYTPNRGLELEARRQAGQLPPPDQISAR
jgi:hypothetical protein